MIKKSKKLCKTDTGVGKYLKYLKNKKEGIEPTEMYNNEPLEDEDDEECLST